VKKRWVGEEAGVARREISRPGIHSSPALPVGSVAVVDVVGHRLLEGVPVGVVGGVDDELADRPGVAFDAVQEADVGRVKIILTLLFSAHWRMSWALCAGRLSAIR